VEAVEPAREPASGQQGERLPCAHEAATGAGREDGHHHVRVPADTEEHLPDAREVNVRSAALADGIEEWRVQTSRR